MNHRENFPTYTQTHTKYAFKLKNSHQHYPHQLKHVLLSNIHIYSNKNSSSLLNIFQNVYTKKKKTLSFNNYYDVKLRGNKNDKVLRSGDKKVLLFL